MMHKADEDNAPGDRGYIEHHSRNSLKKWDFQGDRKLPGAGRIHSKRKDHGPERRFVSYRMPLDDMAPESQDE